MLDEDLLKRAGQTCGSSPAMELFIRRGRVYVLNLRKDLAGFLFISPQGPLLRDSTGPVRFCRFCSASL